MKTDLFRSYGHCWIFQIFCHIECSIFTTSSFRIWNSSTEIPSHPLALFLVMLSKAHFTSYSKMSGSGWMITPSWLSGSWRSFLYGSSVRSCHLFFFFFLPPVLNIFCFCYVLTISVLYQTQFAWNLLLVCLIFLTRSLVFPILLFSSISLHWSLGKAFLFLLAIF